MNEVYIRMTDREHRELVATLKATEQWIADHPKFSGYRRLFYYAVGQPPKGKGELWKRLPGLASQLRKELTNKGGRHER